MNNIIKEWMLWFTNNDYSIPRPSFHTYEVLFLVATEILKSKLQKKTKSERILFLMLLGLDANYYNDTEEPLLLCALRNCEINIAFIFIEQGVNCSITNGVGDDAIVIVVAEQKYTVEEKKKIITHLLKRGAIQKIYGNGHTALSIAALHQLHELISIFLENGFDVMHCVNNEIGNSLCCASRMLDEKKAMRSNNCLETDFNYIETIAKLARAYKGAIYFDQFKKTSPIKPDFTLNNIMLAKFLVRCYRSYVTLNYLMKEVYHEKSTIMWLCECKKINETTVGSCVQCNKSRVEWVCKKCTFHNDLKKNKCCMCDHYLENNAVVVHVSATLIESKSLQEEKITSILPFPTDGGHSLLFEFVADYMLEIPGDAVEVTSSTENTGET